VLILSGSGVGIEGRPAQKHIIKSAWVIAALRQEGPESLWYRQLCGRHLPSRR
jgi:hypothetical protein